jgi:hypothetical protein
MLEGRGIEANAHTSSPLPLCDLGNADRSLIFSGAGSRCAVCEDLLLIRSVRKYFKFIK